MFYPMIAVKDPTSPILLNETSFKNAQSQEFLYSISYDATTSESNEHIREMESSNAGSESLTGSQKQPREGKDFFGGH